MALVDKLQFTTTNCVDYDYDHAVNVYNMLIISIMRIMHVV